MNSTTLVERNAHSIGVSTAVCLVLGLLVHRVFLLFAMGLAILLPLGRLNDYLQRQLSHRHAT